MKTELNYCQDEGKTVKNDDRGYFHYRIDYVNVHGFILFLGIKFVFGDYKKQKRKTATEASASVCLPLGHNKRNN